MELDLKSIFQQVSAGELGARAALDLIQAGQAGAGLDIRVEPDKTADNMLFYAPEWVDVAVSRDGEATSIGNLIVLDHDDRLYRALLKQPVSATAARGCALIRPGTAFRDCGNGIFEARPGELGDFREILSRARPDESKPTVLINAWNLDSNQAGPFLTSPGRMELCYSGWRNGPATMFAAIKAVAELRLKPPVKLMYLHTAEDGLAIPHNAAVAGVFRAAQSENPRHAGRSVCIGGSQSKEWIASACLAELGGWDVRKTVEIRLENSRRSVRRFFEWQPPQPFGRDSGGALPKRNGVYLISGGLGGLGRLLARELVLRFQADLILLGRSELGPSQQSFFRELSQRGSRIVYQQADIGDSDQVRRAVQATRREFPAIHGVIHAAGVIEDALLAKKTAESFGRVTTPKVAGTLSLDLALRDEPLDFFVLFSSLAAVAGNPGQCDYAAGNCFMDAFAESREQLRERGGCRGRTVSINWPLWESGGMKIPDATREFMRRTLGVNALGDRPGLRAFFTALRSPKAQLGVLEGDVPKMRAFDFLSKREIPAVQARNGAPAQNRTGHPTKAHAPESAPDITATLVEIISRVLKVKAAELDLDQDLHDYGMESVLMMEVVREIENRFNIVLDASTIINHASIQAIARHLQSTFGPALLAKPDNSPPTPLPSPSQNGKAHYTLEPEPQIQRLVERLSKPVSRGTLAPLSEPIAVIGMSCRLPGARTPGQLWSILKEGRHSITEVPPGRWDVDHYFSTDRTIPRKTYSKWGGFIDEIDLFDPRHFGVSESDAAGIDPCHRVALELAQELFDNAGYRREDYRKTKTGLFVGGARSAYAGHLAEHLPENLLRGLVINTIPNMMVGRVANFFDLRGPAEIMDTACSSSMVAIQKACRSISQGECEMAIAGGVTLCLDVYPFIGFCSAGALSPTPVPYIFTEQANGFVIGEGAGFILLKPLSKAIADGDMIQGLIVGCAANNDGHTMGWTTPNIEAQKAVLEEAYGISGVSPDDAGYYEAHGTGTLLGDPIEVRAATQVFARHSNRKQYCGLGSVKANIGHTLHTAGVASVMKVLLALRHKEIPPAMHSNKPHPRFKLHESPFFLPGKLSPFPIHGKHRVASASSFGFGGTNCHLVLREWDAAAEGAVPRRRPLPPTQFNRKRFWLNAPSTGHVHVPPALVDRGSVPLSRPAIAPVLAPSSSPSPIEAPVLRSAQLGNASPQPKGTSVEEMEQFLAEQIANWLKVDKSDIDPETNFDELGLDSTSMVEVARNLESEFKIEIYPTLLFEHPNIRKLATYFAENAAVPAAPPMISKDVAAPAANGALSNGHMEPGQARTAAVLKETPKPAQAMRIDPPPAAPEIEDRETPPVPVAEPDLPAYVEGYLARRLGEALSIAADQIHPETNFMELGADSVSLVNMAREFGEESGIELYPTLFFEYPNIRQLAGYFATEHAAVFLEKYRKETAPPLRDQQAAPAPAPTRPASLLVQAPPEPSGFNRIPALETNGAHPKIEFQTREREIETVSSRDIAIIGMSGRFPGSQNVEEFWERLKNGDDLIREIPGDRWDSRALFDPRPQTAGKYYCKWGSFVDGLDQFDANYFRVPEAEAKLMDPQLRFFLESIQTSADDAGYGGRLKGTNTGVYVGTCYHDYTTVTQKHKIALEPYDGTGNASTMLANRPSYQWDLRGPSIALDTACSSSMVAIHLACRALRAGECDMALAGGTNLIISPVRYVYFSCLGALSPTGRCHSFDRRADGYVPAEAVGCLLLKPLTAALRDGDPIHAVIKGSAVKHGGSAASVTSPNPAIQAQVLAAAWEDAMIDPETLTYIEAHGTGTKLGDPIEVQGINLAFKNYTKKREFCRIGTAKAHIGHAEGAAGVTGVIKTALSMKHGLLPAMPGFSELNPMIRLENSPLRINREVEPWKAEEGRPLRAGVSSFGFGGTYVHLVMESFSAAPSAPRAAGRAVDVSRPELFLFSARSKKGLAEFTAAALNWIERGNPVQASCEDLAWTLQTGREHFSDRLAIIAASLPSLAAKLASFLRGEPNCEGVFHGLPANKGPALAQSVSSEWVETGEWEKAAAYWAGGGNVNWSGRAPAPGRRRVPGLIRPFDRQSYWFEERTIAPPAPRSETTAVPPTPVEVPQAEEANSLATITDFLRETLAQIFGTKPADMNPDAELTDLGFDSVMGMRLIRAIQERFNITVYSAEILERPTLSALAAHLHREIVRGKDRTANPRPAPTEPGAEAPAAVSAPERVSTKPVLFILSAPRSGSTLLRVMLAGHSRLFCPPELHLLPFADMGQRARALSGPMKFLNEGLIRAVMELRHAEAAEALSIVEAMAAEGAPVSVAFEELAGMAGGRLLVDKSPTYGESLESLRRSRKIFPNARYIFLARHPCAVIESFARNRFDKMLGRAGEDPWALGEATWARINRNILELKTETPASQWFEIRYEDLVAAPESHAREICEFLGVPFEPSVIEPYSGKRMTDGIHDVSLSIGDPNFLKHDRIEAGLVEDWKSRWPDSFRLGAGTVVLATRLGYHIEEAHAVALPLSPSQREFLASNPRNPKWTIIHRVPFESAIPIDRAAVEKAWREIIQRHGQLRVSFKPGDVSDAAKTVPTGKSENFVVDWRDVSDRSGLNLEIEVKEAVDHANAGIDWQVWPLMKVVVFALGAGRFELVWIHHHLVADGFSGAVVLEELFNRLAASREYPAAAASFADYCLEAAALEKAAGASSARATPENQSTFQIPGVQNGIVSLFSDEREIIEVHRLPGGEWPAGAFDKLAATLYEALGEWTGHPAPTISHRLHGRNLASRSFFDAVGFFAHDRPLTLPLADDLDINGRAAAFRALLAPPSAVPYPALALAGAATPARLLTPVRLNYQPGRRWPGGAIRVGRLDTKVWQPPNDERPYPLDLVVRSNGDELRVIARYSESYLGESGTRRLLALWGAKLEKAFGIR